jgi:hypothetical protein
VALDGLFRPKQLLLVLKPDTENELSFECGFQPHGSAGEEF